MKEMGMALWRYFKGMNTGTNGQISINRNMAWGIGSLLIFVEVYSLFVFPRGTDSQLKLFATQCIVYVVVNIAFILLVLRITSVEKLTELAQKAGGIINRNNPSPSSPPPIAKPEPEPEEKEEVAEKPTE
jgi:hypothetical protein